MTENKKPLKDKPTIDTSSYRTIESVKRSTDPEGIQFILHEKPYIILHHYRKNNQYYSQWCQIEEHRPIELIGLVCEHKNPLNVDSSQRNNKILKQAEILPLSDNIIEIFLNEAGQFLSNNFERFFPGTEGMELEGKKDQQLRRISSRMDSKYSIIRDDLTRDIYIYFNGKYEFHDKFLFNKLLKNQFSGYTFFENEAKTIMSSFTNIKKESEDHISFKNCYLDQRTLEIVPHTPEIFCKTQINYSYNHEAYSSKFEKQLKSILMESDDESKYKLFLQMLGYCFTQGNPYNLIFLITGKGSNGKTTLMNLIAKIFEDSHVSVPMNDFKRNNFGLEPLINAKVNILPDLPMDNLGDTAILKAVSGEDTITIDRKYNTKITTTIGAKLIGAGNALPQTNDRSFGFYRRIKHIELTNTFNPDPKFKDSFLNNRGGIEWLIYQSIKEFKKVEVEGWAKETVIEKNKEYLKFSNPYLWAAEELFELSETDDVIPRNEIFFAMYNLLADEELNVSKDRRKYYDAIRTIGGEDDRWIASERAFGGLEFKNH